MNLTQKLRVLRNQSGLSQAYLAEQADVSRQTIYKWERGTTHPTTGNLDVLCRIFGITMDELLNDGWEPPEKAPPEIQFVEVPVEVPVPQPRNYRLLALLAALLVAAGIAVGALVFRERSEVSVPISTLEGEVIEISPEDTIILLPPIDE